MDWIFEKIFDLVQDILKGDFSDLSKLPALIAVIVIFGSFLAHKQIWNAIKRLRKRVQDFTRIRKFETEVEVKRNRLKQVSDDIEDKIYEIKRQNSLFQTKKTEALERLKVLASTFPENSDIYSLREDFNDLSETHDLSVETIKEIKSLLEQIIDVSRGEEMRKNVKQLSRQYLSAARAQQAARHSQDK
ncbi:MAG: hypothetical protein B0A82_17395 [Alkalinema sp. CACIAM 70d]|nr:MAG: hypothetical protein B0A82_17395 [Alkalinema sp. CACIAM 70d]